MRVISKMLLATVALAAGAGTAAAADLYVPPPSAPIMAPAASNWDGPYIGANIGYSWGTADHTSGPGTNDITLSGFMIGAQLGYNFHVSDNIVLGIEGSADWSNETGSIPAFGTTTHTINYDGMLVGRLGVDMGNFLPYVDAGVAFANATRATLTSRSLCRPHDWARPSSHLYAGRRCVCGTHVCMIVADDPPVT